MIWRGSLVLKICSSMGLNRKWHLLWGFSVNLPIAPQYLQTFFGWIPLAPGFRKYSGPISFNVSFPVTHACLRKDYFFIRFPHKHVIIWTFIFLSLATIFFLCFPFLIISSSWEISSSASWSIRSSKFTKVLPLASGAMSWAGSG